MISIVDMLKRSEKFSLAFDRSMPIRFQQQFWQLIAFLDKHEITWSSLASRLSRCGLEF